VALQGESHDGGSLTVLASSARVVATEALNLAAARQELGATASAWPVARAVGEGAPEQATVKLSRS
jgi:hypothetical protein